MEFGFRSASLPKRHNCAKRLAHQIDGSKDFKQSQRCQRQSPTLWKETYVCLQMLARNLMKWLVDLFCCRNAAHYWYWVKCSFVRDSNVMPRFESLTRTEPDSNQKCTNIYCQEKLNQRMNEWAKNICLWLMWLIPSCRRPGGRLVRRFQNFWPQPDLAGFKGYKCSRKRSIFGENSEKLLDESGKM